MDYQLVVKFWRRSLEDEAFLSTVEDDLREVLGPGATPDGYDISAKEINLFVVTPDPKHSFRRIKEILEARGVLNAVSAGYRLVGGARFTSVWPLRSTRKFKLP